MLGSSNDFFKQKPDKLNKLRLDVVEVLNVLGRSKKDIDLYIEAFDYFIANPGQFDGATIVRDLFIIKGKGYKLDVDAMLHDYEYVTGANRSFRLKHKADIRYFVNMRKNGKGLQLFRLVSLLISGIFFIPYKNLKNLKNE